MKKKHLLLPQHIWEGDWSRKRKSFPPHRADFISDLFLGFHDRGAQNICKMSQHLLFGTKSSSEWARKTRQVKTKVDENQVWQHRFVSKTAFGPLQKISWRSEAALEVFVQLIFEDFCWNSLMHFLEVPGVSYFRREHRATPWGVRVVNNQMFQLDWLASVSVQLLSPTENWFS